jgi:hypothetical protein
VPHATTTILSISRTSACEIFMSSRRSVPSVDAASSVSATALGCSAISLSMNRS